MRSILAFFLIEILAVSSAAAQSQATLVPSLSVSTLHDENVFSTPSAVADVVTSFRPSLEGFFESPTINIQSLASFDMQASAEHKSLNTFDARRQAMFEGRFRTTPSSFLGFAARYDRTETPGDLNLDTGILLARQLASRVQLTPSLSYRVTPQFTLSTQYDWTSELLSGVIGGDLHAARLGLARRWSPLTTLSARYVGRMFIDHTEEAFIENTAIGDRHSSHAAVFGWSREMSPATVLSIEAGPRFTSYSGIEAEVLGSLVRRTPRTRFLIDYWRGETIVLGIQGPVEIHSGSTKMNWALKRNLDLGTALAVFRSATLDEREALVYHASIVSAWSREPYILAVSYGADLQRGDIRRVRPIDEQVHRGVFSVRLTIAPRLSRAFRPGDGDGPTTPIKGVIQ